MKTLTIRGREFQVEAQETVAGPRYVLSGKRGAAYGTMRNISDPAQVNGSLFFLVDLRGFGIPSTMTDVWLTDRNGELEIVKS